VHANEVLAFRSIFLFFLMVNQGLVVGLTDVKDGLAPNERFRLRTIGGFESFDGLTEFLNISKTGASKSFA